MQEERREAWKILLKIMGPDDSWMKDPDKERMVANLRPALGIEMSKQKKKGRQLNEEDKKQAKILRTKGYTHREISKALDISMTQAAKSLQENDNYYTQAQEEKRKSKAIRNEKILILHHEGHNIPKIAKAIGVSVGTVNNIIHGYSYKKKEERGVSP